jgi:hypothetical protein
MAETSGLKSLPKDTMGDVSAVSFADFKRTNQPEEQGAKVKRGLRRQ